MANKKKTAKGKRYSNEERAEILSFVEEYNASHRRGGVTAAAKKFGTSALSISSWLKKGDSPALNGAGRKAGGAPSAGRGKVLDQLATLDREIAARRKELSALETRFEKLKQSL